MGPQAFMNYRLQILMRKQNVMNYGLQMVLGSQTYKFWAENINGSTNFTEL